MEHGEVAEGRRSEPHSASTRLFEALPAFLIAVPGLLWVVDATERASWSSLGRDQGIFQYIAWATAEGDRAYRDVRDVNGPVITMVHAVFQLLGGADEHRFRCLDLAVSALAFALAGACLPSIGAPNGGQPRRIARLAWALAAWVALSAQYVVYGFWDTAQRESFLDWFVLVSIALQATGLVAKPAGTSVPRARRDRALLFLCGFTSLLPWLGKPTYALFTAVQVLTILIEVRPEAGRQPEAPIDAAPEGAPWRTRFRALAVFLAGGALGLIVPLVFLACRGDVGAWAKITFVDVPTMYRFIWPSPPLAILRLPGYARIATLAVLTSGGLGSLIALGILPRRVLPIAAMPLLGLASVLFQAKGFPYHFHPVTLGFTFAWLAALAALWSRAALGRPARPAWRGRVTTVLVAVGAIAVGAHAALLARNTPDPPSPPPGSRDKASLESPERLALYDRIDYFPRALRDAAAYIAKRTTPADRVQTYGMDAYLLFLAGRKSATPYVYSYDLNADAALVGSFDPEGTHPTTAQADEIRAMRADHATDLLARLDRTPPAAFVFIDRSPLMSSVDAIADFSAHCPDAARWLGAHYRQTAVFDAIHIWLRDDLATREPPEPGKEGEGQGAVENRDDPDP